MTQNTTPPPASNTGVEKSSVSLSLDWIEGTFSQNSPVSIPPNFSQEYDECRPFNGYTEGSKFTDGRVMLTSMSRPDMGTHIIWSGGSLHDIPIPASGLVHYLSRHGFHFTRLDFAIDIRNWGIKPQHATRYIRKRKVICRAQKYPVNYDPIFGGYTQYVGTKASQLFIRIYDKAAQMGVKQDWTRVELVAKGRRAQTASFAVIRGEDYRALVMGFVRFPTWTKWNAIMGADTVTIPSEKVQSNTLKWLLKQAAPALGQILADETDNNTLNEFLVAVFARRDKIILERRSKGT